MSVGNLSVERCVANLPRLRIRTVLLDALTLGRLRDFRALQFLISARMARGIQA